MSLARWSFDKMTGYGPNMTKDKWLQRIVFLETVAGMQSILSCTWAWLKDVKHC